MGPILKTNSGIKELFYRATKSPDKSALGTFAGKQIQVTILNAAKPSGTFDKRVPRGKPKQAIAQKMVKGKKYSYRVVRFGIDPEPNKSLYEVVQEIASPAKLSKGKTDISENYKKYLYGKR